MSRVAILGGHGKVAVRLAKILVDEGHEITSMFRKPEQSEDIRQTGADLGVLDLEKSSTEEIAAKIEDYDAVVWSAGAGGGNAARTYAVDRDAAVRSMDAAAQAGADRYVMVSYLGSSLQHGVHEDDPFFPYAEAKATADDYLQRTDLDWTMLGPGRLTLEKPSGRIDVDPDMETTGSDTSRGNVALVLAAALDGPQTIGTTNNFVDGDTPIREAIMR